LELDDDDDADDHAYHCGKNHVMPYNTRQTYNCSKCPFKTFFRTSLTRHSRLMHADVTTNSDTSRHRKRANARREFECNKCQFKTRFSNSLTRHNHLMHGNNTSFTDDTCGSKELEKLTEAANSFHCSNCEFQTASQNLLTKHYRLVHGQQAQKQDVSSLSKLKSNHADKNRNLFDALESVAVATDATENEKVMDNEEMNNDQLQSDNLLSVDTSSICSANDYTNEETSQLVKPSMTPSEHVCNVCGKRCKYARSLALHMKAHNDVKNHISSSKEMDFTSTFSCSRCSFVTSYKSSILRHVNLMHNHKISNPQSADEAVSSSNHGSGSKQVLSDVKVDEGRGLSVAEDNNGWQIPMTTHAENGPQSNCSDHTDHRDNNDNDDIIGGAETDVTTAAECCVSSESVTVVEPEQTVHNDASIQDRHIDRVVDKPAGRECTICGRRFARSLRLHMLAHTGKNYLTPNDTRQTFNCIKCPFKTVFRGSLARHDHLMHPKVIANGTVSHHSKCVVNNGGNPTKVFECNKCQFKTRLSNLLTRHSRLMHKSHKHHNVRDKKEQSEGQSKYKLLNEDLVSDTEMDPSDQVADADAVKDSNEQVDCGREEKQHSRRKKHKCRDHSQVEQEEQPLLRLGEPEVCKRKKYACSECGLMMMHQSAMVRHCKAVHGCGLNVHVKQHRCPPPAVCYNGLLQSTSADTGLYFPQEMDSVELLSSDIVPASGCDSQSTSDLNSTTAVEMPTAATDWCNALSVQHSPPNSSAGVVAEVEGIDLSSSPVDSPCASGNNYSKCNSGVCAANEETNREFTVTIWLF